MDVNLLRRQESAAEVTNQVKTYEFARFSGRTTALSEIAHNEPSFQSIFRTALFLFIQILNILA